ncbi:HECT-like ubiquitin-conjugating enzyme-binding-domain-containing protein [Mycena floridula]|nr:HECT-like ubiquitin-conjugating enzyme-binding-domain-containing protein [Mycena floridula]
MATLVRVKSTHSAVAAPEKSTLSSSIPAPFPRDQLMKNQDEEVPAVASGSAPAQTATLHELMPSIANLERSCVMTLNDLLSVPVLWNPIVPDRRHSMPSTPTSTTNPEPESSSALQTLVTNLRNSDSGDAMVETRRGDTDIDLINELDSRIHALSPSLNPDDAQLAKTLVSLLSYFNRLASIPTTSQSRSLLTASLSSESSPLVDNFNTLKRQLSDFQVERLSSQTEGLSRASTPQLAVESALLWDRIDEQLEIVVSMCKERTERMAGEYLPPQYDPAGYVFDTLPEYETGRTSVDDSKSRTDSKPRHSRSPTLLQANEKMRMDLEGVAMAIDRLYLVAPQLHNQRVELKSTKVAQMEKARAQGKGKQKERDMGDLENIISLIGKASSRSLKDQSVVLEGGMQSRMERARQRDMAKKAAFVEQLAEHSNAGRFHGQDAVLQGPRVKNPEALLSLPEFIRESVPTEISRQDPKAMMTLPEFVREVAPPITPSLSRPHATWSRIKGRDRSLSAPSLSWLLKSGHVPPKGSESSSKVGFEVSYVAENYDNLQHVLVFLTVTGLTPGTVIEAEVLPPVTNDSLAGSDRLIVKSGPYTSLPLILPGRVLPGKKEVKIHSNHFELKLSTLPPLLSSFISTPSLPLLDATQLSDDNPTSFICSSCSLPVVQSSKITRYSDLPSEHWQELVEAWMCHADQKLHDHVTKHSKGFWPEPGQALVGGSYILFEDSSIVNNNLCPAEETKQGEDWRLVRCLCGAIVGRCQSHLAGDRQNSIVYRLLKYAIRPVTPTAERKRIPLSAFIVEDMREFVDAHASYRFVIHDEESERPRILIWLFKPSIQIAYAKSKHYAIPKGGSINAAKVLYKLVGPSESSTDLQTLLEKYPGFPQAEYLFYPMDVCQRLAALLKESSGTYPESMRTLTGLEVGWLLRA